MKLKSKIIRVVILMAVILLVMSTSVFSASKNGDSSTVLGTEEVHSNSIRIYNNFCIYCNYSFENDFQ